MAVVSAIASAAIAACDGLRTAVLVGLAAAAVALTRIRGASLAAAALLAVAALVVAGIGGIVTDDRARGHEPAGGR